MSRRSFVIKMSDLLIKSTKLNQTITHYIGIRRKATTNLVDGVCHDIIVLLQIDHVICQAIASCHRSNNLEVLFLWTTISVIIHTDLDIKKVGMITLFTKQVDSNTAVHTT